MLQRMAINPQDSSTLLGPFLFEVPVALHFPSFQLSQAITMTSSAGKDVEPAVELERTDTPYDGVHLAQKGHDGDEALKILHGEYEPYTNEEEKRVLRKIDIVILIINGLQFVDKNVSFVAT
jgi:hypothetical protein